MAAHRLAVDVGVVVGSAGAAAVDVSGSRPGHGASRASRLFSPGIVVLAHLDAAEIDDGVLHRDLQDLSLAGAFSLPQGGHDAEGRVDSRACVADRRAGLGRGTARLACERHGAADGLRDHIEALVVLVGAIGAEPLDSREDNPRVDAAQRVIAEAKPFQRSRRHILRDDVTLPDHFQEHAFALLRLEIEGDAALVGVQQYEVIAVHIGKAGPVAPAGVAHSGLLDLDYVGAKPGHGLGAGRPRLKLSQVNDADVFESLAACRSGYHVETSCL